MTKFFLRYRKRIGIGIVLLLVLAVGPYAVSRLRSPGRQIRIRSLESQSVAAAKSNAKNSDLIRVLTYNIAHGRGATDDNWAEQGEKKSRRIKQIGKLLADVAADVVILNEVDFDSTWSGHQNQAVAIARAAGYRHWVEQRTLDFRFLYGSVKSGNAVLSQYPIVAAELVPYPALSAMEKIFAGHKQGLICTLQIAPNRQVRVLAVHLDYRSEAIRVGSAENILAAIAVSPAPTIVGGDFNSTLPGFPTAERSPDGANTMELLRDSGAFRFPPQRAPAVTEMTYSSMQPSGVIDWILAPRHWQFAGYRVIDSALSDHRPVVADVRIPPPGEARPIR